MKKELEEITSEINVNQTWLSNFKHFVPLFITEAKKGKDYKEWDQNILQQFLYETTGHCVSSLKQKCFSSTELDRILDRWSDLTPLLKYLADNQDEPNFRVYQKIKKIIRECTDGNKWSATRRLIVALQPKLLTTIIANTYFNRFFEYIRSNIEGGDQLIFQYPTSDVDSWYENSYNLFNFFKKNIPHHDVMDIVTYPWQTLSISLQKPDNNIEKNVKFDEIINILKTNNQIILQGPPGTGKTYTAKEIAKQLIAENHLKEQCKTIQFHPAYSYEDFVRGTVADTENGQVNYRVQNKLLANFAEEAHQNYIDSKKEIQQISKEQRINKQFNDFIEHITLQLQNEDNKPLQLTENVYILDIEEDAIRYGGANWTRHPQGLRLKFTAIKQAYLDGNQTRQDIIHNENLNGLARRHATYTEAVLNKFKQFIQQNSDKYTSMNNNNAKVELKNYVLIIDEINRANLPAVLGELIYALEYRGEAIDALYELDGDRTLTLPPNLYIIGTMNTADRSIGSIDYAIRRRFAFIDIHPKPLKALDKKSFAEQLFLEVASLFINNPEKYFQDTLALSQENDSIVVSAPFTRSEYISDEFNPLDIMLGHSYFIYDEEHPISHKLDYQIKPLLKEYIKDGLLKETALEKINGLA